MSIIRQGKSSSLPRRSWWRNLSFGVLPRPNRRRGGEVDRKLLCVEELESRQLLSPAALGTTALLEGPGTGSDTVLLNTTGAWTANSNASWLHLNSLSGTGSSLVKFSIDADTGATRSGTLTIAGQTLTVTQAGAATLRPVLLSPSSPSPY